MELTECSPADANVLSSPLPFVLAVKLVRFPCVWTEACQHTPVFIPAFGSSTQKPH